VHILGVTAQLVGFDKKTVGGVFYARAAARGKVLVDALDLPQPCLAIAATTASPPARNGGGACTDRVSQPLAEPPHLPPATEQQVRSHARQLVSLAARHGITDLACASPGRLRGHVADDRDLFDMFEFQRAATSLLGAEIALYSDGALNNDHVSPDLAAAAPL